MAKNENLHKAKKAKNDEFYTQLSDIENELKYYKQHFKDKVVLCNCDDPFESNFFKYFAMNFNYLGLKKLICTCYATSPIMYTQLSLFGEERSAEAVDGKKPYKIEITEVPDSNGDGAIDITDVEYLIKNDNNVLTVLKGDGDFRSEECVELLKEADIVCTNPPFSLLKEYVAQLIKYEKKFIILGAPSAVTYKEIFPYIKRDLIWIGTKSMGTDMFFNVSAEHEAELRKTKKEGSGWRIIDGQFKARAMAIWYTNLDIQKRHQKLVLWKNYKESLYPKYVNYDGIDVGSFNSKGNWQGDISAIPVDYDGVMGVPITFLDQYNPDQFEIVGCPEYVGEYGADYLGVKRMGEEWLKDYRDNGGTGHYTANMKSIVFYDPKGKPCHAYKRMFIKRKQR